MNLVKFMKGCTTIEEIQRLPNRFVHSIYHEYVNMMKDEEARKAHEEEQAMEEIEDNIGG